VGKKGRERSPTSMATSTAGAKERKLNAYQKQIGQQHEKPGKNNERGEVAGNGRAMSQTTGNETRTQHGKGRRQQRVEPKGKGRLQRGGEEPPGRKEAQHAEGGPARRHQEGQKVRDKHRRWR